MSNKDILLPLYFIPKKSKFAINEKKFLIFLLTGTLITSVIIFINLPSTNSLSKQDLSHLFLPKFNNSYKFNRNRPKQQEKVIEVDSGNDIPKYVVEPDSNKENDHKNSLRRDKIKNMTLHAWNSYKKYAWGKNELKPLSRTFHQTGIFGSGSDLGATIVDSLDTLHIMGLHDEVKLATDWIKKNFNININSQISAFEVNIRFIGGFLAIYALTDEKFYLDKAVEIADALMPIFNTPTGIPYALVNPISKAVHNYNWAAGSCSILSEVGTFSLEFQYLSDLTGNKIYQEKIDKIYDHLKKNKNANGLYYNYINPNNGRYCGSQASIGGLADSFYEYLLKLWLYKNKSDKELLDMYLDSIDALKSHVYLKSKSNLGYFGEYSGNFVNKKMGHLACFAGGLFGLTAIKVDELNEEKRNMYKEMAVDITNSCHESYIRTKTHLGPESFGFEPDREAMALDRYYILRPEVIESYFYLWRITKDEKYRDWAWDAAEALEKYCKTENGYSGIKDVNSPDPQKDDVQQSFFIAETLKYLYLIFSEDDLIPFDKFVFNTEAHPFRIKA